MSALKPIIWAFRTKSRPQWRLTAAQQKAASERMRRRWAAKKKEAAKAAKKQRRQQRSSNDLPSTRGAACHSEACRIFGGAINAVTFNSIVGVGLLSPLNEYPIAARNNVPPDL